MFTIACYLTAGLGLRLWLGLDLVSGWLCGYAHVFVLLLVVIVTLPCNQVMALNMRSMTTVCGHYPISRTNDPRP